MSGQSSNLGNRQHHCSREHVSVLDCISGTVLRRYGLKRLRFSLPFGVATTDNGQILIADQFNHRILLLKGDGTLVSAAGSDSLQFQHLLSSTSPMRDTIL